MTAKCLQKRTHATTILLHKLERPSNLLVENEAERAVDSPLVDAAGNRNICQRVISCRYWLPTDISLLRKVVVYYSPSYPRHFIPSINNPLLLFCIHA